MCRQARGKRPEEGKHTLLTNRKVRILGAIVGVVLLALAGLALAGLALDKNREPSPGDVRVSIEQLEHRQVRVVYRTKKAIRWLNFGALAGQYREVGWRFEGGGFRIVATDNGDSIERIDGRKFNEVSLIASPHLVRLKKEYQPLSEYGEGGVMIYTGHFSPMTENGGRANVTFDFTPRERGEVVAFGDHAARLENWRSPTAHPAFVYMGSLEPVETSDVMAVVDPTAPPWIIDEFDRLTPLAFSHLATVFGFSLETKPNLFLTVSGYDQEGRLSYSGDALPGQFQITLEGASWLESSKKAVDIFRLSTIHEAVHLWQARAHPRADEEAPWIHEGAADAIAAQAMLTLGLWSAQDYETNLDAAHDECAIELKKGSLAGAQQRGDYRALYACGQVISQALAGAQRESTASFWRAFIIQVSDGEGYTADDLYDFVAIRAGDQEFSRQLRYFVETPHARPEVEIDKLFDLSAASRDNAPLAPAKAR